MSETKTVKVEAELPEWAFEALKELAFKRGENANTVLQRAIATEKYFADKIGSGAKVLLENPDKSFRLVEFKS